MARRQALLDLGGFDEALYPNEENALMDDLQKQGGKLLYDPEFVVYRRPRSTLGAFFRMLLTYGRGRAEQFRLHPTFGSAINFAPPLFCAYLLALPWSNMAFSRGWLGMVDFPKLGWMLLNLPLWAYAAALILQTAATVSRKGLGRGLASMPLVYCANMLYGLGFWHGLFTRLRGPEERKTPEVTVERIAV
jgi:hypothetical protein